MVFSPTGLTPLLGVYDMPRSVAFYRDLLGFEIVTASPEVETPEGRFSHWVWLRLGAAELMLNTQYDSGERPENADPKRAADHGDTTLYVGCTDIDQAYAELTRRGLRAAPPQTAPYGLRLFSVTDPDGYSIVFQESRQ
jgi:catechol 2,3-dioxygenase-like lactoylglutathione lyase family enzyme